MRNRNQSPFRLANDINWYGSYQTGAAQTDTKTKERTGEEKKERERREGEGQRVGEDTGDGHGGSRGPRRADDSHQRATEASKAPHSSLGPLIEKDKGKKRGEGRVMKDGEGTGGLPGSHRAVKKAPLEPML